LKEPLIKTYKSSSKIYHGLVPSLTSMRAPLSLRSSDVYDPL